MLQYIKCHKCNKDGATTDVCRCADKSESAESACSVSWDDVACILKWTLRNAKHLDPTDNYLIEKEIDRCHLDLMQSKNG